MKPKHKATGKKRKKKKGETHSSMLMRPHLEQCIQCGICLTKNEQSRNLEIVQRQAIRMIKGLERLS